MNKERRKWMNEWIRPVVCHLWTWCPITVSQQWRKQFSLWVEHFVTLKSHAWHFPCFCSGFKRNMSECLKTTPCRLRITMDVTTQTVEQFFISWCAFLHLPRCSYSIKVRFFSAILKYPFLWLCSRSTIWPEKEANWPFLVILTH